MAPTFKPHVLAKSGTRLLYPTRLIILYWPRSLFGPNFQIADDQPPLNADLLPSDGAEHSEVQFHRMPNVLALAGPNSRFSLPNSRAAGFLAGFWHGLIAPIALFVSLFKPTARIYESKNRGRLYDFGFLLSVTVHGNGRLWIRTTLV